MTGAVEHRRALVVVRTYPVPTPGSVESSCTAAITDKGEWLRVFPVPWRLLPQEQRFRKYQWVDFATVKAKDDARPESYHLKRDGIRVMSEPLSTAHAWRARKDIIWPLRAHCLCCLSRQRDAEGSPTLGIVRPASINRLRIAPDSSEWTEAQLAMLRQQDFFAEVPERELEKIPFKFFYGFQCPESTCNGHTLMCTDWEMGESYRQWRSKYGEHWEAKFRQRYEFEMMKQNDTHFFVGTVASHPHRWIIIGLFYPPHEEEERQLTLF